MPVLYVFEKLINAKMFCAKIEIIDGIIFKVQSEIAKWLPSYQQYLV
jgi:hypothetical protein